MLWTRSSGVLLHPTSLPGPYGVGDFGPGASQFLEFLAQSKQSFWQVLPLNPTGATNSPYLAFSAFAGNPLLISPDLLVAEGLIPSSAIKEAPRFPPTPVDFSRANRFKGRLLRMAHKRFKASDEYEAFCSEQRDWLDDFAFFVALKNQHRGADWNRWEEPLAARRSHALKQARQKLAPEISFHKFVQHLYFRQYARLRREAGARGIRMIGDLPIFVSQNSADVWSNPHLFHLDAKRRPTLVAGVPPDYFSKTGQRWGNALYRWEVMQRDGFAWWRRRLQSSLQFFDVVRLDHFRGLQAYWAIPAHEKTAVNGKWVAAPGNEFLKSIRQQLGDLPIIAEDLGVITPEVEKLRDRFGLPGMKVLEFGFSDPKNEHLPHNFMTAHCVVYTGTHDNDTARGWWASAKAGERRFAKRYLGRPTLRGAEISWELIHLAMRSVAKLAIVPLQDLLNLGSEARMNRPGVELGNWGWRYQPHQLTDAIQERLGELTTVYGRAPEERRENLTQRRKGAETQRSRAKLAP
jgi:4-alpha-glucanotransferase